MRLKGKMHQIPHRELEMRPLCQGCSGQPFGIKQAQLGFDKLI
jgi:hypothetical protein